MSAPDPHPATVHIVWVGPFGRAVSGYLKGLIPDTIENEAVPGKMPLLEQCLRARINAVAAWRSVPDLCEFLDKSSHESRRPFLPLILDATALRLGPVVVPGSGGCWSCWMKRSSQHAPWPKEQDMIRQYYSAHPNSGPEGYLEPFAMMGAIRIKQTIDALDSSTAVPGYIWQINMLTRQITTGVVAGLHDCPQCGLHRSGLARSFTEMRRDLAYLWEDDARQEIEHPL